MINKKLVIAHRGACFYEKENTIAAFRKAIELKADMIEFDVRKTKDNKMIVFHDEEIDKKEIKYMGYQEIIRKSGCKVPTLEKTLKFLKGKIKIIVHLKEEGYEKEAVELILKYFKKKDIIIFSEIPKSLNIIKDYYPDIKTGLVIDVKIKNFYLIPFGIFTKRNLSYTKTDFIAPRWQIANKAFLKKAEKYKKIVFPWEIRNRKTAERFLKKEIIGGIITNKPDLMK